jgi:Holliday junction resolvase YEN1
MGPTVAHVLARLGFGRDLVIIMTSRPGQELDDKLAAWRNALREELRTNSRGGLGKRCPKLAEKIVDTFPRLEVVHLYMNPLTSTSPQFVGPVPNSNAWTPQEPNIPSNPS